MNDRLQHIPPLLPIYALREQVMFPHMVFPLFIQPDEMPLIEEAMRSDHLLGLVMCSSNHVPLTFQDLAKVGTVCRINQVFRFPEGGCKVVVEGIKRIRLIIATQMSPYIVAKVNVTEEQDSGGTAFKRG